MVRMLTGMDPESFSDLVGSFSEDMQGEDEQSEESDEQFAERLQREEYMNLLLGDRTASLGSSRAPQSENSATGNRQSEVDQSGQNTDESGQNADTTESDSDDSDSSSDDSDSSSDEDMLLQTGSNFSYSSSSSSSGGGTRTTTRTVISTNSRQISDMLEELWDSLGMDISTAPSLAQLTHLSSMSFDSSNSELPFNPLVGAFSTVGPFGIFTSSNSSPNSYEALMRLNEMFPPVNRSIKDETLEALPEVKCTETGKACSICLTDFEMDEMCLQLPKCGHLFHGICVKTWLKINKVCPTCRKDVEPEDE